MAFRFTRTNRLMDECLSELDAFWAGPRSKAGRRARYAIDALEFPRLVRSEVVVHEGCYLLWDPHDAGWTPDPDGKFVPGPFIDRTGWEDSDNHMHMGTGKPGIHNLAIGLAAAEILQLKLQHTFPGVRFCISVSMNVKPIDEDDKYLREDCRISFHAVRDGETMYGDLEGFKFEAVGELEF